MIQNMGQTLVKFKALNTLYTLLQLIFFFIALAVASSTIKSPEQDLKQCLFHHINFISEQQKAH